MSHDTYKFGLEFPNPDWSSGLWPGGHFLLVSEINGEMMQKPYTPITPVNHKGVAQFIIKIYRESEDHPGGGKFSSNLEKNVNVGDNLMVKGPVGMLRYHGYG